MAQVFLRLPFVPLGTVLFSLEGPTLLRPRYGSRGPFIFAVQKRSVYDDVDELSIVHIVTFVQLTFAHLLHA